MTLLDQEVKEEEPKGKKIILLLLVVAIILLIFVIVAMVALGGNQTKSLTLSVNGSNITIDDDLLITDENDVDYISISKIAKSTGYDYLTGEYKQYNEDSTNTKCYLQSENQIIQFEADTNIIYKTDIGSILDYEEYELNYDILTTNDMLYVALDDISVALNVTYSYSQNDNAIAINTVDVLTETYQTYFEEQVDYGYTEVSTDFNNEKAIAYGMMVVSNEGGKWGVISTSDYSTIIGNKYTSLEFVESAGVFIASDDSKYGVISTEKLIMDLKYEEVSVITNSPLCYQVKLAGRYGIINGSGQAIINNEYESMGYISDSTTEDSTLLIKEINDEEVNALVVCKNSKYGLVSLNDGSTIVECSLDKIYAKTENGEKNYYIELQEQEISLDKYISYINTTTVEVN